VSSRSSRGQQAGRYAAFGHGLYPEVAIRIITVLSGAATERKPRLRPNERGSFNRQEVRDEIVRLLPQPSQATRRAVANKMIQRFELRRADFAEITPTPFVRLVGNINDRTTRIQLLLWQLSRVDTLVGAVAQHVLYPYLVQGCPPKGWSAEEFHVVNDGQLFTVERFITLRFIEEFARRAWRFTSRPALHLAVRILMQCGRIVQVRQKSLRYHPKACLLSHEAVQLVAFVFGIHQELLPKHQGGDVPLEQIIEGEFAKTMLITPEEVSDLVRRGVKYGFFRKAHPQERVTRLTAIRLSCQTLDELVDGLLKLAL